MDSKNSSHDIKCETAENNEQNYDTFGNSGEQLPRQNPETGVGWCFHPWNRPKNEAIGFQNVTHSNVETYGCFGIPMNFLPLPNLTSTPAGPLPWNLNVPVLPYSPMPTQMFSGTQPLITDDISPPIGVVTPFPVASTQIFPETGERKTPSNNFLLESHENERNRINEFGNYQFRPIAFSTPSTAAPGQRSVKTSKDVLCFDESKENAPVGNEPAGAFQNLQRWAEGLLSNISAPLSAKNLADVPKLYFSSEDNYKRVSDIQTAKILCRPDSVDSGFESFTARGTPITPLLNPRTSVQSSDNPFISTEIEHPLNPGCTPLHNIPDRFQSCCVPERTRSPTCPKGIPTQNTCPETVAICENPKCTTRDDIHHKSQNKSCKRYIKTERVKRKRKHAKQKTKSTVKQTKSLDFKQVSKRDLAEPVSNDIKASPKCAEKIVCNLKVAKERCRKQSKPRRSPGGCEHGFRGVTLRITTRLTANDDSDLSIQAYFSSRKLRKLFEKKQRQRLLSTYCRHRGYISSLLKQRTIQRFNTSKSSSSNTNSGKQCASCSTKKTPLWRDAEDGTPLCNACGIRYKKYRVRCVQCYFIPRKEGKSHQQCFNCGGPLKFSSSKPKMW